MEISETTYLLSILAWVKEVSMKFIDRTQHIHSHDAFENIQNYFDGGLYFMSVKIDQKT
jgi:hypothetical protein